MAADFGASTWFLAREGFSVDGIDGSAVIINRLLERLRDENLDASVISGDISDLPYPVQYFDCVIDIACLMCNDPDSTRRILGGALIA